MPTFTSTTRRLTLDLARKLMRYIRDYNRNPKPIKWTYRNLKHRIMPDAILSVTGN